MSRLLAATASLALALAPAVPALAQGAGRTTKDGVFTAAQADRGQQTVASTCALCHGESLAGGPGAPTLKGPEFTFGWKDKSVGALFDYVKSNMPPGQAGSLSDQQYVDLVADILRANDAPAGAAELPADPAALGAIKIAP